VNTTAQLQGFRADEAWEIDAFNLQGKLVFARRGVGNEGINTAELPNGLYTVLIRFSGTQRTLQLIKE